MWRDRALSGIVATALAFATTTVAATSEGAAGAGGAALDASDGAAGANAGADADADAGADADADADAAAEGDAQPQSCHASTDCATGESCLYGTCRPPCTTDSQCAPLEMLCANQAGYCIWCRQNGDCSTGKHCEQGECVPAVCATGTRMCASQQSVTTCGAYGGWNVPVTCSQDQFCADDGDGSATCETQPNDNPLYASEPSSGCSASRGSRGGFDPGEIAIVAVCAVAVRRRRRARRVPAAP